MYIIFYINVYYLACFINIRILVVSELFLPLKNTPKNVICNMFSLDGLFPDNFLYWYTFNLFA